MVFRILVTRITLPVIVAWRYEVTAANRSDDSVLPKILDVGNTARDIWGDTAYHTQTNKSYLGEKWFRSQLHHKTKLCQNI